MQVGQAGEQEHYNVYDCGSCRTAMFPNFIYGFFSYNMAGWVVPWMAGWWAIAMFGAIDSMYIMGPYPRENKEKK